MNNMLTFEEVKSYLDTDQNRVEKFIRDGKLHAYKIGGTFVRFRKEEVLNLRNELFPKKSHGGLHVPLGARVSDFWRFNNFYIISLLVVVAVIFLATRL